MNQPWVYMCSPSWTPILPSSPSHPSGSSWYTSPEHPVSCIEPGLAVHFTYDHIHVSMLFSQIILPSPSPTESKSLFFISVSLFLLTYRVIITIFLNSIYMHWCFSFWLPSLCIIGSSFIHLTRTDSDAFFNSWVIFNYVYVPQLSYPFICLWTSRLLPCPSYCKQCCDETFQYTYLFQFWFPQCVCPAVGLLGHMAVLFSDF